MRLPPLWKPGLVWLLFLGPFFFISYGLANQWAASRPSVPSIVFDWERHIPLWPWTILPYWSIDLFYGLSLLICRTRLELARHARRLLTVQVISVTAFVLFPLRFSTPRPPVDGWAGALFDALAGFDLPYNQAPSLHIGLLIILWDFYRQRMHGAAKFGLHVWSALIGVSVLTTYQHHFIDLPTGLLAGALCLWLWPLEGDRPRWQGAPSMAHRRLALVYGGGALLMALLAGIGRAWWWLYWPAVSLALVALCYAALGSEGFQKRAHGRHSLASRWLLWPYRGGAWLNARGWTRRLPPSVAIDDRVWLGRLPLAWEADHRRFAQIVDLAAELPLHHPGARSHGWLDLTEPTPDQLLTAAQAVEQARADAPDGPVLVACALGFSRSAAVVVTWLCVHGARLPVDAAIERVRQARPQLVIRPPLRGVIEQAVAAAKKGARMTAPLPDNSDAHSPAALTAAERAACAVCADTLATGRVWAVASLFASVVVLTGQALAAAGSAALCSATRPTLLGAVWLAMLVCSAASVYLALRVALDARLFDRLARGDSRGDSGSDAGGISSLPLLDGALQQVLSVPAHKAGRSVDARIAGALRLWRVQAWVTALWAVPAVAAWWRC